MKPLLDFNLSPKLLQLLSGLFPGTTHAPMTDLPAEAQDIVIWEYAKRENFSILTADRDFLILANRFGPSGWPSSPNPTRESSFFALSAKLQS